MHGKLIPYTPIFFEGHALQQAKSILDYDLKPVRNLYAGSSHGGDGRDSQLWRFGGRHGRSISQSYGKMDTTIGFPI